MESPDEQPKLSVIIPTYNRCDRLRKVLAALAAQTTTEPFEVVVVSDGSTDGTDAYLLGATPLPVVALTQINSGPAAARNHGVRTARGRIVLFIDDDVVPAPELVDEHLRAHARAEGDIVAIGPMLNPPDVTLSPWVAWEQHQLYKQYDALRHGVFPCSFRQFYTGNASVPRDRVIDVGLFDTKFRRAEDVELAFRLDEAGVGFEFVPEARAFHYAERAYESWLSTAHHYGRNDVTFIREGQRWMTVAIPTEFAGRHPLVRWLTRFGIPRPRTARAVSALLRWLAVSRVARGPISRLALSGLYNLTYYRGVADALGSPDAFAAFIDQKSAQRPPRAAFVLEQTLGHVTHSANLRIALTDSTTVQPVFLEAAYEPAGVAVAIPLLGNSTIRVGLRARAAIRHEHRRNGIDVMFIHTQVAAIFTGRWMRRIPTIVSLDATPLQYDELGEYYRHRRSAGPLEALKKRANVRCYQRAKHLVTWSSWARESLIADYGIAPDRISVVPPGVHVSRWQRSDDQPRQSGPVRVLFVAGALERKGGLLLLEATARLRADPSVPPFELHVITKSTVEPQEGVVVHREVPPNSAELIALFHSAAIFCLPTFADCLPMVLSEASAAGLALVATDVGAIREVVRNDETGLLVPAHDLEALVDALALLLRDDELRARLGKAGHDLVSRTFDAQTNADSLVTLMCDLVPSQGWL